MRLSLRILAAVTVLCLVALVTGGLTPGGRSVSALGGLTISPPLREITLGPGLLEASTDVTLQNNSDQTVRASLQLVDLRALGQYGGNSLDKAGLTGKYDLANWLTLPGGNTVDIAGKQTVRVAVKIANRSDLAPGGHYGAIVITSSADNSSAKSQVSLNQQVVSLLFIKKLGGEVYGLQLESSTFKRSSDIPQIVTTNFKNTGNVHLVPHGYIEVTDPVGKLIAKGIINQDSLSILPGSLRKYVTTMQPVAQASRPGTYKVTTYYRYDDQKDFKQFSETFSRGGGKKIWLFIASGVAVLVIAAGAVLIIIRKHYRRIKR